MPTVSIPDLAANLVKEFGNDAPRKARSRAVSFARARDKMRAEEWKQIADAAQLQLDEERRKQRGKL